MRPIDANYIDKRIDESIFDADDNEWMHTIVANVPTIELKQGKWEKVFGTDWKCSCCNYVVSPWNNTPFCPNCGAQMKGDNNETD